MNDKVSVIIPVYNHKELLERSYLSVKQQDYPNIECIIVDDGSTDGTSKYCDSLKVHDKNLTVLHQQNKRQGAARNTGIAHASGKYIFFLDSDDWIEKNTISRLVNLIKEYDAQIAVCSCFKQTSNGTIIKNNVSEERIVVLNRYEAFESYVFDTDYCNHSPCDKLYDISLFEEERFIENSYYEDLGSVYKFVSHADRIVYTNIPLYCYYDNLSSTMHKPFSEHEFDKVNLYHILSTYFLNMNDFKKYEKFISHLDKLTVYSAINFISNAYKTKRTKKIKDCIKNIKLICKETKHVLGFRLKIINYIITFDPKLFSIIWNLFSKITKQE